VNALHTKLTLDNDGTHYVMHDLMLTNGDHLICVETGWGSGYGQWIHLDLDSIAWSYLTEKMPGLRDGDKPGYKMMFAKAGIEVFG
jgi:hypothetical protein